MSEEEIIAALKWLVESNMLSWPDREFAEDIIHSGFSDLGPFFDGESMVSDREDEIDRARDLIQCFTFQLMEVQLA